MPSVSVVVLHHNKAHYSRACLDSLLTSTGRPLQIVNVDNGSNDETPRILDEWEAKAQQAGIDTARLRFEENIGAIRGRNEALKQCHGDYIAFLDNDTVCGQADWLERLSDFLDSKPDCALVCPKLVFPWEPFQIECLGAGTSRTGRIQYIGRGDERDSFKEPFTIQCAISAAWLARRTVFDQIGDLDEVFSPVQYEDLDWCFRAREAGFSLWADPSVEVFHFEHTTTAGSNDINFRYVTAKNSVEFKKRWAKMFTVEDGPSDADCKWRDIERKTIEQVNAASLLPRNEDSLS
ncbi:glycosyltransferase family 2 protein [bacterium]|nr:MAG: glycosyltransferase family 2 protein [bacterium]